MTKKLKKGTPRRVLVTGATTPIGERLCRALLEDDRIEHVLAIGPKKGADSMPFGQNDKLTYKQFDLSRNRHVRQMLFGIAKDLKIDVIMHLSMHRSMTAKGARVHALNVDSLRSIIELSGRHPTIKRLIFKSDVAVYQVQRDLPVLITESHPLNMGGGAPQWVRDRVEADVLACTHMGLSPLEITVLRTAEVLAPGTGSQLFDFLSSPVCFKPLGYDPMLNLLSLNDVVRALSMACFAKQSTTIVNIPGADTMPLSSCIERWGRISIPLPGLALTPVYKARQRLRGTEFSYGANRRRFHYAAVLDGSRAEDQFSYKPEHPIHWPSSLS